MTKLGAKVKAFNMANAEAMKLQIKLQDIFKSFVGKQVTKTDGCLLSKIEKLLPVEISGMVERNLTVYRYRYSYSLLWVVKACENYGSTGIAGEGCEYAEASVHVGDLESCENHNGSVLKKLSNPLELRTDFTEEEISEKRRIFAAAKSAADEARSNLHPFGEYDR